jgi:hypothetical protein
MDRQRWFVVALIVLWIALALAVVISRVVG